MSWNSVQTTILWLQLLCSQGERVWRCWAEFLYRLIRVGVHDRESLRTEPFFFFYFDHGTTFPFDVIDLWELRSEPGHVSRGDSVGSAGGRQQLSPPLRQRHGPGRGGAGHPLSLLPLHWPLWPVWAGQWAPSTSTSNRNILAKSHFYMIIFTL